MLNPSLRGAECDEAIQNWTATQVPTDGLIFIPGWGFHASVMQPMAERFFSQAIHYADLPLIHDDRQTFQTIVEKLHVSLPANSTIVAWSLGGLFAIALCALWPEKYKKLILLASNPKFNHTYAKRFLIEAEKDLPHLMKHFLRLVCFPSKSKLLRLHLEKHVINHEASLRFYLKLLFQTDLTIEFNQLTQPVFQIAGEKDAIMQSNNADLVIANGGHAFFLDPAESNIPSAFNKAAKTYDQYTHLQQHIGKKLIALLPNKIYLNTIDLGCGTGTTTAHLANTITFETFYAVDNADKLLALAFNRLAHLPISIEKSDFDNLGKFNHPFDLAFSNMALHWSRRLELTLKQIAAQLNREGLIAFSLPLQGTFRELENYFSVNPQASKEHIIQSLEKTSLKIIAHQQETHLLKFNSTLDALRSIKNVGATHVANRKYKTLLGKSFLQQHTITELTYEIGYFIAKQEN